tara:strand:- start:1445 stop:2164 length:720 start_codon:yes stop_codon:yes gene_type:complete
MNKDIILEWLKKTDVPLTTISKKTNISRSSIYNWINGGDIRRRSLNKIVDVYKEDIKLTKTNIRIHKENDMEAQYIIDLQKDKIKRLEADLKIKEHSPIQDTVWKELQCDFIVDLSITFDNFVIGRTINKVSNKETLIKHLGYDLDEIDKYWAEGVYYKQFKKHPIDQIITKESLESVTHNVETMPTLFETFKMMVGNHYIPIPITYIHKDGSHVHTICYNKVDWLNKSIKSKSQFISQ